MKASDWTHKNVDILDIRKLKELYVLRVNDPMGEVIDTPLFVNNNIFEERLKSYFLRDMSKIDRRDILSVKWNMYITKGYYIKILENGEVEKFHNDLKKWYVSYLEIVGLLGSFHSIYAPKEI